MITRSALGWTHGRSIAERAAAFGIPVIELASDQVTPALQDGPGSGYADAKATLAIVVA
ncbi:MAG: radical SAM protein, partial [Chitinophagales bacterium]|nr:radical SAM protein [Hyphomicrobiales bacterium]